MPTETSETTASHPPGLSGVYSPPRDALAPDSSFDLDSARRATPWTITTYFAEGLPFSLVHQVSAELFTAFGASLEAVGYTSFYGLAWNLKFVWSPLVERYGSLRGWIVAVQVLLAIVMAAVAGSAGSGDIPAVALALVFVAFLGATQDVAVDGYYLAALDKPAQASLSGTRVGAYRAALLAGKSGLVVVAGLTTWRVSFLVGAAMFAALAGLHRVLLRPLRRPIDAESRGPAGAVRAFIESFRTFLQKPDVAPTIAFILTFKAGDALLFNQSVPFLKSLGLDTDMRGLLSTPSLIMSVAGTAIGGVWIRRASLARTLFPISLLQALAIPLYSALAIARPAFPVIAVAVSIEQLIAGVGNAALLVFLMRRCEGEHKTAHFAFGSAIMSIPVTAAGAVSGGLARSLGFADFFLLAFVAAVPGVLLSRRVPKD